MAQSKKTQAPVVESALNTLNTPTENVQIRKLKAGVTGKEDTEYEKDTLLVLEMEGAAAVEKMDASEWEAWEVYMEQYTACRNKIQNVQVNIIWESLGVGKNKRNYWRRVYDLKINQPEDFEREVSEGYSARQIYAMYFEKEYTGKGNKGNQSPPSGDDTPPVQMDEKEAKKKANTKMLEVNKSLADELKGVKAELSTVKGKLATVTTERDALKRDQAIVEGFLRERERYLMIERELFNLKILAQSYNKVLSKKNAIDANKMAQAAVQELATTENIDRTAKLSGKASKAA